MEREVGGGIGMGNTCKPMADSFQCMTKPTTIKKKERERETGREREKGREREHVSKQYSSGYVENQ